jgi:hypothetical protein
MTDKDADPAIPTGGLLPGDGAQSATPDAWSIEIANDYGSRTYTVTDDNGQQRYAHEDQLPLWVVLALGREWLAHFAALADGYYTWNWSGASKDDVTLTESALSNAQAWQSASTPSVGDSQIRRGLRDAWKAPLEQRAALVADTVTYAVRLLDSLQKEIAARSALVQALAGEVEAAQTQAEHAAQLARLNEEQAAAVNAYLDRLLADRLGTMERHSRRREWVLATASPWSWAWRRSWSLIS